MAAPIGGLSNAKWRDDKAIIEINAEQADKRLANVLAEQEKKNKQSNDPLAYVHSGVENRMELWDRRNLGNYSGKLEARIRRPRYTWEGYRIEARCIQARCHQATRKRNMRGHIISTRTTTTPCSTRSSRRGY